MSAGPGEAWAAPGGLPFTAPALLAPMEGVTDPAFRDLVLDRNGPAVLGGAFTEFVRVVRTPVSARSVRARVGAPRRDRPVGVQLMGSDPAAVAASAARVATEGAAPLVDLNFGCPAKGALRGCAGAALLDDPRRVEALVAAVVAAVEATRTGIPVTAKIRAGGEDDRLLEDLARAVEAGGARLLTVHCRTRREGYRDTADWERLRRAVAAVSIPVCGNGGVEAHADLRRLLAATGCRLVMVGRAALADPWIFSGRRVERREAAGFLVEYARALGQRNGASASGRAARVKQLLCHWRAGGLVVDREGHPDDRRGWLREPDPERLLRRLERAAGETARKPGGSGPPRAEGASYTPALLVPELPSRQDAP